MSTTNYQIPEPVKEEIRVIILERLEDFGLLEDQEGFYRLEDKVKEQGADIAFLRGYVQRLEGEMQELRRYLLEIDHNPRNRSAA